MTMLAEGSSREEFSFIILLKGVVFYINSVVQKRYLMSQYAPIATKFPHILRNRLPKNRNDIPRYFIKFLSGDLVE